MSRHTKSKPRPSSPLPSSPKSSRFVERQHISSKPGRIRRKHSKTCAAPGIPAIDYYRADSGYVARWYLDEDCDGDCFVDCQMFLDFARTQNLKAALKAEVDPQEFRLRLTSQPFPIRCYKRIAVKVVDVYGSESTIVREI